MPIRSFISFALSALAVTAVMAACDGATGPEIPAVAAVQVTAPLSVLDPGDTVRLTAELTDADGAALTDDGLVWRSEAPERATVDSTGLVTALARGPARIEAEASNGTTGGTEVRVSPVSALRPDTGRYGAVVAIEGADLPTGVTAYFTGEDGGRVEAFTRSSSSALLEVWVPVGAVDGPLELVWPGDSAMTRHEFGVTAPADVFGGTASAIGFPYENPSLLADGSAPHALSFTLTEASPFTLRVTDRGAERTSTAVRAWLFRTDVAPAPLMGFVVTREHLALNAVLDSAAYSRASLPAGDYTLLVAPMDLADPAATAIRRPFGIRLAAEESFDRAPDGREPNDYPAEAPTVGLPFTGAGLGAETPFAMDHYAFDVADTTALTVTTTSDHGLLLVYLLPAGVVDILAAWEDSLVLAVGAGEDTAQTVQATVPPGQYTALVWDWGGRARPYDLEITGAAPAADLTVGTHPRTDRRADRADRADRTDRARVITGVERPAPVGPSSREGAATAVPAAGPPEAPASGGRR